MTTRRKFVKKGAAMIGGIAVLNSNSFGFHSLETLSVQSVPSFGFQSWTIRKSLNENVGDTCSMMAGLGYKEIEMCSPLGYSDAGFGPLNKLSGYELHRIIEDSGLKCTSSHFNFGELKESLDDRMEWAHQMGMHQMMLASFWLPKEASSLDDYRRSANELNQIAARTQAQGFQMGFHNHHMEFEKRGEMLIYDAILEELDPDLVKMQFQVAVVDKGYKAADYFRKYPGRFISAHLQDWSKEKNVQVPLGKGVVDWIDFFEAAKIGGVKNVFVEMAPETFEESARYLSNL